MGRTANPDIRRSFVEFQDTESPAKCLKVRCLHCGYVRAKNTTRQIEHLQECDAYLNSPEASAHVSSVLDNLHPTISSSPAASASASASLTPEATRSMLNGTHPNPNLQVHRRGPNQKRKEPPTLIPAPARTPPGPPSQPSASMMLEPQPSLAAHLLSKNADVFNRATQQAFLSHAGCGTLAAAPLAQWMVQDGHYTRGYLQFIGALIGKIRLPPASNSQFHPMYRTMDLLISAINNIRREMRFFEITATKYGIQLTEDPPNFITRSYLDLFAAVSSPAASLLEGMVVLWATEHAYRCSWIYAQSFATTLAGPSSESHIAALHQSLIPNWTSDAFAKFVNACRGLVDDLANSPTIANGEEELRRCEMAFRQVCWLAERFWPDVDGIGDDVDDSASASRLAVQQMRLQGAAVAASSSASASTMTVVVSIGGVDGSAGAGAGRGEEAIGGEDDGEPDDKPDSPFDAVMNGAQDITASA